MPDLECELDGRHANCVRYRCILRTSCVATRVYFAAGLNTPLGGSRKLAKYLGTLLVETHGEIESVDISVS